MYPSKANLRCAQVYTANRVIIYCLLAFTSEPEKFQPKFWGNPTTATRLIALRLEEQGVCLNLAGG